MLSSFLIGTSLILGFLIVYLLGMLQLSAFLERRLQNAADVAKYWGAAWGAWTIAVAMAFGLVSVTDFGQPISKLGPYISGFGILFGLMIVLAKFKPNEDHS